MVGPLSAVLVDDEPLAREALRGACERTGAVRVLAEGGDGAAALDLIGGLAPDVVFLDISMPGLSGLEVAGRLARFETRPMIVFVTAFDHYAVAAFDLSVVDYVLKPIEPERFDRAVRRLQSRAAERREEANGAFWLPLRGGMVRIDEQEIERVQADRDYVRVFALGRSYLLRETIGSFEARLSGARFLRVSRSSIVRIGDIRELRHVGSGVWAAVGADGQAVRIGRTYLPTVRARLGAPAQPSPAGR